MSFSAFISTYLRQYFLWSVPVPLRALSISRSGGLGLRLALDAGDIPTALKGVIDHHTAKYSASHAILPHLKNSGRICRAQRAEPTRL